MAESIGTSLDLLVPLDIPLSALDGTSLIDFAGNSGIEPNCLLGVIPVSRSLFGNEIQFLPSSKKRPWFIWTQYGRGIISFLASIKISNKKLKDTLKF